MLLDGHVELKAELRAAVSEMLAERPGPLRELLDRLSHLEEHPFDVWREVAAHLMKVEPEAVPKRVRYAMKPACWMVIVAWEAGRYPGKPETSVDPAGNTVTSTALLPEDAILELLRSLADLRPHQAPS